MCCAIALAGCGEAAASPTDQATEFWEAVASGDVEAATAAVDPGALESGSVNLFGRAATLDAQFDWYEAVGWEWALDECVESEDGSPVCTVTATNSWSDALGVEPVGGTYQIEVSETGITGIEDVGAPFIERWSPRAFEVFANWVVDNHPDDADVMFDFSVSTNDEILELYRVNSERFVEAQSG